MNKIILLLIVAIITSNVFGQNVKQAQPSIVVVPHTKEGEDIRTVLENDFNKRIAISKVKEAFDKRNFETKDFVQMLKNAENSIKLNSNMKTDIKTMAIKMSGADIWVDTEVFVQKSPSGNSVKVILQAYDTSTSLSLSNKTGDSGKFYTDDIAKLSEKAIESCIEPFLDRMNEAFGDIVENGRPIKIEILIDQDSEHTLNDEIGADGDLISELIEDWLDDNAYKNNYHIQYQTDNEMVIDEFRIPLRDQRGRNYKASKVLRKLRKYAKSLGLDVKKGVVSEGKIELILL